MYWLIFHLCWIKIRSNIARLLCHTSMVYVNNETRLLYSAIRELLPFVPICNKFKREEGGGILAPFVIIERKKDICIWYCIDYNLHDRYPYLSNITLSWCLGVYRKVIGYVLCHSNRPTCRKETSYCLIYYIFPCHLDLLINHNFIPLPQPTWFQFTSLHILVFTCVKIFIPVFLVLIEKPGIYVVQCNLGVMLQL